MFYKFFTSLRVKIPRIAIRKRLGEFDLTIKVKEEDVDKIRELIDNVIDNGEYTFQIYKESEPQ